MSQAIKYADPFEEYSIGSLGWTLRTFQREMASVHPEHLTREDWTILDGIRGELTRLEAERGRKDA